MARYTCLFTFAVPVKNLHQLLIQILEDCNFDIIYETSDYLMGREVPGQFPFAQLVTVELLIDKTMATDKEIRMSLVIKNETLPLQVDNHCRQMFEQVSRAIAECNQWQVIEAVAS